MSLDEINEDNKMKKIYISPVISVEMIEDDNLMINASHTQTTSYLEDDPSITDDDIIIHPEPVDPGDMDDDDDY